jgi:hypothetical protein
MFEVMCHITYISFHLNVVFVKTTRTRVSKTRISRKRFENKYPSIKLKFFKKANH